MNVELISVGTELLLGDIVNTNAQYLSKELAQIGINIYRQTTVGDNMERLQKCFEIAFEGCDVVITTGGLGPTTDDMTKEAAAAYFGQEMVLNEEAWKEIEARCLKFSKNKESIPNNNKKQAMFPKEAQIIPNDCGTAPGAVFEKDGKRIIVMPGPPREMKDMFRKRVLPILKNGNKNILKSKYIRFFNIGESKLEIDLLELLNSQINPTIALYAKEGEVLVRVTASAIKEEECDRLIEEKIKEIEEIVGEYIYLIGDDSISETQTEMDRVVAQMLIDRKLTISTAESCTGGLVASSLVNYPGVSDTLLEGCVTYSNEAKMMRLGVKPETLEKYGAVSSQTAEEMARGIASGLGTDIGVSTTGIAGPGGGTEEKPVGLVYFGVYYKGETYSIKKIFAGDRQKVRMRAAREALNQVRLLLKNDGGKK